MKMLSGTLPAGNPAPAGAAALDLAKPVERCIQSMYGHADAVDEIDRVVECGTVDGRPVDLAWLVTAGIACEDSVYLASTLGVGAEAQ